MSGPEIIGLAVVAVFLGTVCAALGSLLSEPYWRYRRELAQHTHELELKKLETYSRAAGDRP